MEIINATKRLKSNCWEIIKYNIIPQILSIIFPASCAICRQQCDNSHSICTSCFEQITFITDPMCNICGEPFEHEIGDSAICSSCLQKTPAFDIARSVFIYDDASKPLVTRIKYNDKTDLIPVAARLLTQTNLNYHLQNIDYITTVPIHWKRLLSRRYNQANLLAKAWVKIADKQSNNLSLSNKLKLDMLKRTKHTPPQASLNWKKRQQNVKKAFAINKKYEKLSGKTILLIDDVMTTGATIRSCCYILRKAKAERIYVLTLAKRMNS